LGSLSGIGDPETTHKKIQTKDCRGEEPYLSPCGTGSVLWRRPCWARSADLAAQGATNQFGEAQVFASRFLEQELLEVSREPERHRHAAFWQLRSGHEAMCIIVSYTSQD